MKNLQKKVIAATLALALESRRTSDDSCNKDIDFYTGAATARSNTALAITTSPACRLRYCDHVDELRRLMARKELVLANGATSEEASARRWLNGA